MQIGFSYADGSSRFAFAKPSELTVVADEPGVVDVARPARWRIAGAGRARVTVHHAGLGAIVTVTGVIPDQPYRVPLTIASSGTNQVSLSWPAGAPGILQALSRLPATNWTDVSSFGVVTGAIRRVTLPGTNATEFFRVQP